MHVCSLHALDYMGWVVGGWLVVWVGGVGWLGVWLVGGWLGWLGGWWAVRLVGWLVVGSVRFGWLVGWVVGWRRLAARGAELIQQVRGTHPLHML